MKNKLILAIFLVFTLGGSAQANGNSLMPMRVYPLSREGVVHQGMNFWHRDGDSFRHERSDRDFDHDRGHRFDRPRVIIIYPYPYYQRYEPMYTYALSISDIVRFETRGLSDDQIINEIKRTRSVFYLSSADVVYLRNCGVSNTVIDFMLNYRYGN